MKRSSLVFIVIAASWVMLAGAESARPTPPGENGRITYRIYFNAKHTWGAIFTMDPDGSDTVQVTDPRHGVLHTEPDWSPSGQWITYTRVPRGGLLTGYPTPPGKGNHIFIIRPDGTGRRDLTEVTCQEREGCIGDRTSSWSPDGDQIALVRKFDSPVERADVFVIRADGTHARQLTNPGPHYSDNLPQWSPDGERIAFNRYQRRTDHDAVFTMTKLGRHLRRITPWEMNCTNGPDWAPDGHWILINCVGNVRNNLWLVRPNGTDLHRLTRNPDKDEWASSSFSPDGTMIVTSRLPGAGDAGNADVYVMNVDGSGLHDITNSDVWDSSPDWGPKPTY
jgi:Tol biopolymer transport system component